MNRRKTVLITGAAGNLGSKVRHYLESQGGYDLILIDVKTQGDPAIRAADLSAYEKTWASWFVNVDAIVHFAADGRPRAPWESVQRYNVDMLLNVLEASVAGKAKRFVFASSNHVMAGYKELNMRITHDLPPRPLSFYGISKAVGERITKSYSDRYGLPVICLRIGWNQPGGNPTKHYVGSLQKMWLSNRDLCQIIEKAVCVNNIGHLILNAMSNNPGMPWDLSETRRVLGYSPCDACIPIPIPLIHRLRDRLRQYPRRIHRFTQRWHEY